MALTLSCDDGRLPQDLRYFTWTEADPNHRTYCNHLIQIIGCLDPSNSPQYDTGIVDAGNASIDGIDLTCAGLVQWKLAMKDFSFISTLSNIGCPLYSRTDGSLYTKCSFTSNVSSRPTFSNCSAIPPIDVTVKDCQFNWSCSVNSYDSTYRPICCSGQDVNVFSGIDPISRNEFNDNWAKKVCAPNWCLSDPALECRDVWEDCATTSSCGRHAFLTAQSPVPTDDLLLNIISITGFYGFGLQCNSVYNAVVAQAFLLNSYTVGASGPIAQQHVQDVMDIVRGHCADPRTKGNGECSCLAGYYNASVDYAVSFADDALLTGYQDSTIPLMVVQNTSGGFRRVDAYCEYGPEWVEPLTNTDNGQVYSNACSTSMFWSASEYMRPTLNPIKSVFSLSNFGDVNIQSNGLNGADGPANAMPLHCWLPACVGTASNGQSNHAVFPDLHAFTKTCPSVCYMYSAGSDVNINDVDTNSFINMGSNFQGCSFDGQGYATDYNPFLIQTGCEALFITAPINFQGIINLNVSNPTHDNASELQTRLVSAFSNIPQVSFYNDGDIKMEFNSKTIYKYKSEEVRDNPFFSSTANLQLYVNTSNTSAFTSFLSEIVLYDGLNFFQSIPVTLIVYPDANGSGGTSFSAQVCGKISSFVPETGAIVCAETCDCSFGSSSVAANCPQGDLDFVWPKRRLEAVNLPGSRVLTTASLLSMGAAALLQSHIDLYG